MKDTIHAVLNTTVPTRNDQELDLMRQSGQISAQALKRTIEAAKPGVSLLDLEKVAEEEILRLGGGSSFKTVQGYFWTTCLTLNEEVVHGIPRDIKLQDGDILGIDLGAVYQGWHTDTAWSVLVGQGTDEKRRFLKVGDKALWAAIDQAIDGNRIGDISSTIQKNIEGAGYFVVKNYIGHGVGKSPHEEPEIPGIGKPATGLLLREGMTLAIEVIYTQKKGEVTETEDGWTVAAGKGNLGGLFEMTVVVGKKKAEVLTDWRAV